MVEISVGEKRAIIRDVVRILAYLSVSMTRTAADEQVRRHSGHVAQISRDFLLRSSFAWIPSRLEAPRGGT